MTFDLTTAKSGEKFKLRDGRVWTFKYVGSISRNIAIGVMDDEFGVETTKCLFASGKYRMDGAEHSTDIVGRI